MDNRKAGGIGFVAGDWPLDPDKYTLVFIHGAASSNIFWESQVKSLSGNINTVAIDLPGHGLTKGPGMKKISDYAGSVIDFIDLINPPNPVPCGLSMGGAVAQHLLVNYTDRFSAGILINTGARLKVMPLIFETIEKNYSDFIDFLYKFAVSENNRSKDLSQKVRASLKCLPEVASDDFYACDSFDVMGQLNMITVPVLVLTANDDRITPLKYGSYINESINNSQLVSIKDAGHLSPLEKPGEVNRVISEFLGGIKIKNRAAI